MKDWPTYGVGCCTVRVLFSEQRKAESTSIKLKYPERVPVSIQL